MHPSQKSYITEIFRRGKSKGSKKGKGPGPFTLDVEMSASLSACSENTETSFNSQYQSTSSSFEDRTVGGGNGLPPSTCLTIFEQNSVVSAHFDGNFHLR